MFNFYTVHHSAICNIALKDSYAYAKLDRMHNMKKIMLVFILNTIKYTEELLDTSLPFKQSIFTSC